MVFQIFACLEPRRVPSALHSLQGRSHLLPSNKFFLYLVIILPVHILNKHLALYFPLLLFSANPEGTKIHLHSNLLEVDRLGNSKSYKYQCFFDFSFYSSCPISQFKTKFTICVVPPIS